VVKTLTAQPGVGEGLSGGPGSCRDRVCTVRVLHQGLKIGTVYADARASCHLPSQPRQLCPGPLVALLPTPSLSLPLPLHSLNNYSLPHEAIAEGIRQLRQEMFFPLLPSKQLHSTSLSATEEFNNP